MLCFPEKERLLGFSDRAGLGFGRSGRIRQDIVFIPACLSPPWSCWFGYSGRTPPSSSKRGKQIRGIPHCRVDELAQSIF